jgi:uncharacterized protein (DUF2062 family)
MKWIWSFLKAIGIAVTIAMIAIVTQLISDYLWPEFIFIMFCAWILAGVIGGLIFYAFWHKVCYIDRGRSIKPEIEYARKRIARSLNWRK